MKLRERERFLKLNEADIDDCQQGEYGWLAVREVDGGGAIFEMTTNTEETLSEMCAWIDENCEADGDISVTTEGKTFSLLIDGKPMPFDMFMEVVNKFR